MSRARRERATNGGFFHFARRRREGGARRLGARGNIDTARVVSTKGKVLIDASSRRRLDVDGAVRRSRANPSLFLESRLDTVRDSNTPA